MSVETGAVLTLAAHPTGSAFQPNSASMAAVRHQVWADLKEQVRHVRGCIRALAPLLAADECTLADRYAELSTLQRRTRAADDRSAQVMRLLADTLRRRSTLSTLMPAPTVDRSQSHTPEDEILWRTPRNGGGVADVAHVGGAPRASPVSFRRAEPTAPSSASNSGSGGACRWNGGDAQLRAAIACGEHRLDAELEAMRAESGNLAWRVRLASGEVATSPHSGCSPRARVDRAVGLCSLSLSRSLQRRRKRQDESQTRRRLQEVRAETQWLAAQLEALHAAEAAAEGSQSSPARARSASPAAHGKKSALAPLPPRAGTAGRRDLDRLQREAGETARAAAAAERQLTEDKQIHQHWVRSVAQMEERLQQLELRSRQTGVGDIVRDANESTV